MRNQPSLEIIRKRQLDQLRKLGGGGVFVAASLNRVERKDKKGRTTVYHLLTFKEEGRTRSVYVPKDLVGEVRRWVRNYQKLKKAVARISQDSIALIRGHVPQRRAASARSQEKGKSP
jgi:hypothetical protein